MSSINKAIKEASELAEIIKNYPTEDKAKFLQAQVEALESQMYRCTVDIEMGKKNIKHGEDTSSDEYVNTGEKKIQETVQSMRPLALTIAKTRDMLEKVQ